jgi:hypothetical protein
LSTSAIADAIFAVANTVSTAAPAPAPIPAPPLLLLPSADTLLSDVDTAALPSSVGIFASPCPSPPPLVADVAVAAAAAEDDDPAAGLVAAASAPDGGVGSGLGDDDTLPVVSPT